MKIKKTHSSEKRKLKKLKGIWICFIIIILILVSLGIFIFKDFGLGYKYYEIEEESHTIYIGSTMKENYGQKVIDDYLAELEMNGYIVVENALNVKFFTVQTVIPKSTTDEEYIKETILNNLEVTILCTKLIIENDDTIYYFKTQEECDKFIEELNKYIEQKYSSEGVSERYGIITKQEILDNKIESVKAERERLDAEEAARKTAEEQKRKEQEQAKAQVSSRGGTTIRTPVDYSSNYSGGAPLASYVYISSPFGYRSRGFHTGVDFAAASGTHVYAWKSGVVTNASWSGGYGNFIVIQHNDGTVSRYAHLSGYNCSVGQTVTQGQTIGFVGSTGNSTGAHLHFEILIGGDFVNPLNYL